MIYLRLVYTFFKIGLFSFGGGYAMLSFIEEHVVARYGWMSPTQFADMVALSQMTPGPVSINVATFVGYTASGSVGGAVAATLALCLPSVVLMILISKYLLKYRHAPVVEGVFKGLRPAIVGLIAGAALLLCTKETFVDYTSYLLFAAAFAALYFFKAHPILLILAGGLFGILLY